MAQKYAWAVARALLLSLVMALAACTKSVPQSAGSEGLNFNGTGVAGVKKGLRDVIASYPPLTRDTEIYCRSLDADLDTTDLQLMNPAIKDLDPQIDITIRRNPNDASLEGMSRVLPIGPSTAAAQVLMSGTGPMLNAITPSVVLPDTTEMNLLMDRSKLIERQFTFGFLVVVIERKAYYRNVLCQVSEDMLAFQSPGPAEGSGGDIPASELVSLENLPLAHSTARPDFAGSWEIGCSPGEAPVKYQKLRFSVSVIANPFDVQYFGTLREMQFADANCTHLNQEKLVQLKLDSLGESSQIPNAFYMRMTPLSVSLTVPSTFLASAFNMYGVCDYRQWPGTFAIPETGNSCSHTWNDFRLNALFKRENNGVPAELKIIGTQVGWPLVFNPEFTGVFQRALH